MVERSRGGGEEKQGERMPSEPKNNLYSASFPWKFYEHFDTSESHEIWYIEILAHAEHEAGLSFLITIISNTISPLLA